MKVKFYAIEGKELTTNQQIIASGERMGLYRNLLSLFGELSFHELAARVAQYKESHSENMVKEEELGYCLLRLIQEGLVGMKNVGPCKKPCCSIDNVEV